MYTFMLYGRNAMVVKHIIYSFSLFKDALRIGYIFLSLQTRHCKTEIYTNILSIYLWKEKEFTLSVMEKPKVKQK